MPPNERRISTRSKVLPFIYLVALVISVYLLFLSRGDEVYSVWLAVHPAFVPMYFITTLLLLVTVFTNGKVEHKLLFVILHSIVSHSLFVIIFPAGRFGIQQAILGRTRLVFDNVVFHGLGWGSEGLLSGIYSMLKGQNFQTATSTILARMLGVDVYWPHLLLVPVFWGIFIPVIAFMISKTLGLKEDVSVLSGVVVSLFPTSIIWAYESIPNGLSYLFFFCFICFLLRYLRSGKAKDLILMLIFLVTSALSHYLAGTVALSLLILAHSVKTYHKEKESPSISAKLALLISLIFCTSIMPFALAYRNIFYPASTTFFSLNRFREAPLTEMILPFLLGSYFDFISRNAIITTLIFGIAPLVGLIGMVYILGFKTRKTSGKASYLLSFFLFLGFLLIVGDDRVVKFFMVRVPFTEVDRLWVFRDLMVAPFATLLIFKSLTFSKKILSKFRFSRPHPRFGSILVCFLASVLLSGWVTMSVYYAYPRYGPLQTTTYEIEAVKYIDETTEESYIVIADQWIILAGQMFVGINNPRAFYFSHVDQRGITFFIQMKNTPSNETLIEAMKTNNATVAYFIIEKPRLGAEEYNQIVQQAQQNGVQTCKTFYHQTKEKLRIFYYKTQTNI